MKKLKYISLVLLLAAMVRAPQTQAQTTEDRFHDLFVTAGYSTAFGAALGAAFLAFTDNPASQLKYVAMGASLGFIGGSILGTYIIFSPMFVGENIETTPYAESQTSLWSDTGSIPNSIPNNGYQLQAPNRDMQFTISPVINYREQKFAAITGELKLLTF